MDETFTIDELLGPMTPELEARLTASFADMPPMPPEDFEELRRRARIRGELSAARRAELNRRHSA